ncbi:hypothetical protein AB0395_29065 [Streptosporangium sp. NPDC051023]|uniref:hypothetical protein n=1 Tax=Streptosporangium sp. NPDC051023 TaxID=3155410 RepID=UPI00344D6D78
MSLTYHSRARHCPGTASAPQSPTASAGDTFPVTIGSALGDAVIGKKPERVVTWGWSNDLAAQFAVLDVLLPADVVGAPYLLWLLIRSGMRRG